MGESLHVDPGGLRAHGAAFLDAADRAQQIFDRLTDALAEAGPCWGDDEPGKQFAVNYTPDADRTVSGFREVMRALRDLGDAVTGASGRYDDQDVDAASRIAATGEVSGRRRDDEPPPRYRTDTAIEPTADPAGTDDPDAPGTRDGTDTTVAEGTPPRPADETRCDRSESPSAAASPQAATAAAGPETPNPPSPPRPRTATPTPGVEEPTALSDRPPQVAPPPVRAATRVPGDEQARGGGAAGTPWSRLSGTSTTPWSGPDGQPRPSSRLPAGRAHRAERTRRARAAVSTSRDPRVLIAEALAARRGIAVTGFDAPHVDEAAVRQFAAAVDDLLDAFPTLGLRAVRIAELEEPDVVLAVCNSTDIETIVLNRRWAADPERLSAVNTNPGPVYNAVVHEVGRAAVDLAVRSATETRKR
ncbi:WXG100 family type VII secretion target [Nocardia sp. N2S4-5]|uniref:WXG100 family type VII secretion target n=1 Tax=Nocardia sp. N2S4-5 TaxID=3351565 RepID=UPI0037D552F8